jgi:hypothetical protein
VQTEHEVTAAPRLEELCRDAAHCSCAYGNVVIFYSNAEPDSAYLDRSAKAVIVHARKHPAGLGMLVLIAADEPPPSEAGRRAIRDSYVAMNGAIHSAVFVVEGEGFAASAKRSVIALFSMAEKLPFPISVAGDATAGAEKLVKMLGPKLHPQLDAQLVAAAASAVKALLS